MQAWYLCLVNLKNMIHQEISKRIHVCEDNVGLDGIKYRGQGPLYSNMGFWYRRPGNEEFDWSHSNFRLLEITKDLNDDEVWDIRSETGLQNHNVTPAIGHKWYRNLMTFEYLLNRVFLSGVIPDFKSLTDDELIHSFNMSSSARINCKKTAGGGECTRGILNYHINAYGDILQQQVMDLNPNAIYIGGCEGNIILDKVVRPTYDNLRLVEPSGWVYYCESKQAVVVNGYNPGMRRNLEKVYNEMASALRSFAKTENYNNFVKAHALRYLRS